MIQFIIYYIQIMSYFVRIYVEEIVNLLNCDNPIDAEMRMEIL